MKWDLWNYNFGHELMKIIKKLKSFSVQDHTFIEERESSQLHPGNCAHWNSKRLSWILIGQTNHQCESNYVLIAGLRCTLLSNILVQNDVPLGNGGAVRSSTSESY